MSEQAKAAKTQRLAAALRDNLRRRKVARQAGASADARPDPSAAEPTETGANATVPVAKNKG